MLALPKLSCDCHAHVFINSKDYPFQKNRSYTPHDASEEEYLTTLKKLGFSRGVLVQPSVYGRDNSYMLHTMENLEHNKEVEIRGVVVIDSSISELALDEMHKQGVRGVRMNWLYKGCVDIGEIKKLTPRLVKRGWHLQLLIDISKFVDFSDLINNIEVDCVIDHFGHLSTNLGVCHESFQTLLNLLAKGKTWVKLSGSYRMTKQQTIPYTDVIPFAKALIKANPDRLVYGTDWPHPSVDIPMPKDNQLLDSMLNYTTDRSILEKIFVENPKRLYQF